MGANKMNNIKSKSRVRDHGEVFTPRDFVNEMLDTLPKEVWANENLKWLDNSCGIGNFLFEIKRRLSEFHSAEQINKMIYGLDIQADNIEESKHKTGLTNIVCADALRFNYWNIEFDIIVGNPPYNKPKGNKKGNTCHPLWPLFVNISLANLKKDGYLVFVHPPGWRKPEHKILKTFLEYKIKYIRMFDIKESMKIFNVGTKVDFYCLQKSKCTNEKTIIIDERNVTHSIVIRNNFIPNHSINQVYKLFGGINSRKVLYNCTYHHHSSILVSEEKTDEHIHPCIYLANKKGITYCYSSSNKAHFGIPKVIIPMGSFQPIMDFKGEYGMCEVAFAIIINSLEEGNHLMNLFSSDDFLLILSACKWKTFQLDWRLFKYLNG